MAMDRGGTGTSQGSSSNQKGGSGEGSKNSSNGNSGKNQGSSANNRGSSQSSSSGSSKGSSSSSTSSSKSSSSTSSKSSPTSKAGTTQAGNQQGGSLTAGKGGLAGGDGSLASSGTTAGKKESSKPGVANRVSSVNQALSSYGAAPAAAPQQSAVNNQSLASSSPQKPANTNMSEAEQRAAYSAGAGVARDHGVIANLVNRNNKGIATNEERAQLTKIADSASRHNAATVYGGTAAGSLGSFIGNGLASLGDDGGYYSGLGEKVGTGEMKGVLGSINDKFGQGGMADTALGVAANVASAALPGAGLVFNAISNGLKAPNASAIAEINKALGRPVGVDEKNTKGIGNNSGKDYVAPPRQSLTGAQQGEGTLAFDSSYYDPSRFNVTAGKRGY
ncbi:hypothetical protein [Aeromonas jandaei]|uniref:hypothetical protein n=1 Tax=Aeromonas jandaei TaxID=650 RepID=UPI000B150CB0|nr:hypothetical protein [Aeromonas jandaei]